MLVKNYRQHKALLLCLWLPFVLLRGQDCTGIWQNVQSSNIQNYSFEEIWDCPWQYSQMNLAVGWIQASVPTSDLVHFCGSTPYLSELPTVPLPIPDGQGLVAMLNLYDHSIYDSWLEYVGTCPTQPMQAFTEYTLRFFVGFGNGGPYESPDNISISLFGNTNCNAIPFNDYGCPIEANPSWKELAQTVVSGNNEWVEVVFQFTPTTDIASIVLGPSCQYSADQGFIFMDELILLETQFLEVNPTVNIIGTPCEDALVLSASPASNDYDYEWFKNGALIPGATNANYTLAAGEEGFFFVRLTDTNGNGCEESGLVEVVLPDLETMLDVVLCYGDSIKVAGEFISSSGADTFAIQSVHGCDSTIYLELEILDPFITHIDTILCAGEQWEMSGQIMDATGQYVFDLHTDMGCDSTVTVDVIVHPEIEVINQFTDILCAGDTSIVNIQTISGDSLGILWQDGTVSFDNKLPAGDYTFTLTDAVGCTSIEFLSITEPPPLEGNVDHEDITCIGFENGWVSTHPQGGVGTYEIFFEEYPYIMGDSATYLFLIPGEYKVTVMDQNGCIYEELVDVVEPENPEVEIIADQTEMTLGNTQRLRIQSNNTILFDQFKWTPSEQMSCAGCPVTFYTPAQIGTHYVSISTTDENGCIYSDSLLMSISDGVAIPNAFTPNGDSVNDRFYVMGQGIEKVTRISVYSRNGAELYRARNVSANIANLGWDGTFEGRSLGSDVYVYLVELVLLDGTELIFSGDVTLIR